MVSAWTVRRQPCSRCGDKVVIVQSGGSALGGLLRTKALRVQHADFQPTRAIPYDQVDGDCRRGEVTTT